MSDSSISSTSPWLVIPCFHRVQCFFLTVKLDISTWSCLYSRPWATPEQPHPIRVHTTPGHTHVLWERCLVATISISLFMRGVTDSWRVRLSEEDKTEDKYTVRTCMLHILVQKSTFLISITTSTFYTVHVVSGTREQIHISPASVQYTVDTCMYMLSH